VTQLVRCEALGQRHGSVALERVVGACHSQIEDSRPQIVLARAATVAGREDVAAGARMRGARLVRRQSFAQRSEQLDVAPPSIRLRLADPQPSGREIDRHPSAHASSMRSREKRSVAPIACRPIFRPRRETAREGLCYLRVADFVTSPSRHRTREA
jgi:hypothetical protein